MADTHHQTAIDIIGALRAAGMTVELNADGDLALGGTPRAMAVWHAMSAAITGLEEVVIAALTESVADPASGAATIERDEQLERRDPPAADVGGNGSCAASVPEPASKPESVAEKWTRVGAGAEAMIARLQGLPVPTSAPQVKLPWERKAGPAFLKPEHLAWCSRRDRAIYLGEPFNEPPPSDMPAEQW
jgi:hypothetical protein